ncbi:hypothetical protein BGZ76_002980 [Entomortierella beljakovae]|nr:hypothetical protein BGZ76_002980 [Entomortierella beljakovae]
MVKLLNKSVVFLKPPVEYPIPGVHLGVSTNDVDEELNDGEVRTRNLFISVDPYLRGRINGPSYLQSFQIGSVIESYAVGQVIASKNTKYPVGSVVVGIYSVEEYSRIPASKELRIIEDPRNPKIPLSYYVGVLGMPGFSAYGSLLEIGKPKSGETIFISAASGALGQLVGQISKRLGLRVVGTAGSSEKVKYLIDTLKFDAAFNYKDGNILESLRAAAPEGIDIYYDNVGGEILDAALEALNRFGRIVISGLISGYNTTTPYGYNNLLSVVTKSLKIQGYVVNEFSEELRQTFVRDVKSWLLNDEITYKEDITEGVEHTPEALLGLLQGKNFGKAVVKVSDL